MSEQVSVVCPMCGAGMTLKDRSKLGKKASCPNCSNLFVLTEVEDDVAPPASSCRSAQPAARPSQRASGASSGKAAGQKTNSQPSKSAGGSNTGLLVGGGAVAVLLLVGVGLWASGMFSGGDDPPDDQPVANGGGAGGAQPVAAENKINLAYIPADAELFVRLKLADAWKAPLLMQASALPQVQEGLQQLQQKLGLGPADVESVTIGASGVSEKAGQPNAADPTALASAAQEKTTAVFRLTKAVDAASLKLVENGCRELQHESKTYYLFEPPADETKDKPEQPVAVFLAESKLIVLGSETQVQSAISSSGKQTRRADLDFINPDQQLLIVIVPKDKELLKNSMPTGGGPGDPAGEMAMVAAQKVQAVGIGLSVGTGIGLTVQANCTDTKAAGEMKQILDGLVVEGRSAVKNPESGVPPFLAEPASSLLTSLQSSVDNSTLTASINIDDKTIASLQQVAPFLMLGMMAGNGGGPPVEAMPSPTTPTPVDVPAETPDGFQVSAITRWSDMVTLGPDGKRLPPELELWVYLMGKQPASAIAWGMIKADRVIDENDQQLKLAMVVPEWGNPTDRYEQIHRMNVDETNPPHPKQGVRAVFTLEHPANPVSRIKQAQGEVSLLIAKDQKKVIVKDVLSKIGKEVNDPVVKEAGLRLKIKKDGMSIKVDVLEGNSFSVVSVWSVDAAGKQLESGLGFRADEENPPSIGVILESEPPAGLGLELELNLGVTQVDVPFSLTDIRVPVAPNAPGAPPANSEGVPDGLKIAGKTEWSTRVDYDQNRQALPPALDVLITMKGDFAKTGVEWGFVEVTEASGTDGEVLELNQHGFSDASQATQGYVRVTRGGFDDRHPTDGVTAVVPLRHPAKPIRDVTNIEGMLKLRTATEQQDVKLANLPELSGMLLADPALKKAGLSLKLDGKESDYKLTVVKGDENKLARVEVVTADGKKLPDLDIMRNNFGEETVYRIASFGAEIPATAVLKLTLNLELTELEVPFHFKNLPVPDLPLK